MSEHDGGWKQRALADFRVWLDGLAELPESDLESEAQERREPDLRALFAEFAALRQEVRLQNREQSRAGRELAKATECYETATRLIQRREDDLAAFEKRIARESENQCLRSILEVRDALARGLDAATGLREPRGLFRRAPRGIASVVEGYELALRRVDRMLSRFGVERLKTTGHPFDSHTMQAMEVRRVEQAGHGVVVEELLSGFTREGDVLRLADVAVNRLDTQE